MEKMRRKLSPQALKQCLGLSLLANLLLLGLSLGLIFRKEAEEGARAELVLEESLPQTLSLAEHSAWIDGLFFSEAIDLLHDRRGIEKGVRVCDLALSRLLEREKLDLGAALPHTHFVVQKKELATGREKALDFYFPLPRLSEKQLDLLIAYAEEHDWPLEPVGLARQCRLLECAEDPSLVEALLQAPPSLAVQGLLEELGVEANEEELTSLLLAIPEEIFADLHSSDWGDRPEMIATFFRALLSECPLLCTEALVALQGVEAVATLPEELLVELLGECWRDSSPMVALAQAVVEGEWSESLKESAQQRIPSPPLVETSPPAAPEKRELPPATHWITHEVAYGDSLWNLAQRYGSTVKAIQEANGLSSTTIRRRQLLKIPSFEEEDPLHQGAMAHTESDVSE